MLSLCRSSSRTTIPVIPKQLRRKAKREINRESDNKVRVPREIYQKQVFESCKVGLLVLRIDIQVGYFVNLCSWYVMGLVVKFLGTESPIKKKKRNESFSVDIVCTKFRTYFLSNFASGICSFWAENIFTFGLFVKTLEV